MQSRRWSATEAVTNAVVSCLVAWLMYITVIPWMFGTLISPKQSAGIVLTFNVVSLVRQFILRRLFNSLDK